MKQLIFVFLFFSFSCNAPVKQNVFESIPFELEGFDWAEPPYSLSKFINDSLLPVKGPQFAAWEYSYIGNQQKLLDTWDQEIGPRDPLPKSKADSFKQFNNKPAIEYILKQAEKHQVVIVNEAHHIPQHRVFTTQLLEGLYSQGYRHLGLEAYFSTPKSDSLFKANGYPVLKSGFYTKEPQFGQLIRKAHQLGFNVFGYESRNHSDGKGREIGQAKNVQEYMEKNPEGKVLLHCGFDHGYEGKMPNKWEKAMAGRFTEFTGIDPFTVNQTTFSEKSKVEYENPYYQLTDVKTPTIYFDEIGKPFGRYKEGAWFDVSVFHPRSKSVARPNWLLYGDRQRVEFSLEGAEINCPCLVFAYVKGEALGVAVPYDLQESIDEQVTFVLEPGEYEVVAVNEQGKAVKTRLNTP